MLHMIEFNPSRSWLRRIHGKLRCDSVSPFSTWNTWLRSLTDLTAWLNSACFLHKSFSESILPLMDKLEGEFCTNDSLIVIFFTKAHLVFPNSLLARSSSIILSGEKFMIIEAITSFPRAGKSIFLKISPTALLVSEAIRRKESKARRQLNR